MDWGEIWNTIKNFFTDNVWNIVAFFAALIIGLIVIKLIRFSTTGRCASLYSWITTNLISVRTRTLWNIESLVAIREATSTK